MERESADEITKAAVEQKISYADRFIGRMSVLHRKAYEQLVRSHAYKLSLVRHEEEQPARQVNDWLIAEAQIKEQIADYVLAKGGSIEEDAAVNDNRAVWRTTYRAEIDILMSLKNGDFATRISRNGNE